MSTLSQDEAARKGEMLVKSEKSSKPDGFVIYSKTLQSALLLPDDSAGRVLKAAARLFLTGEAPEGLELSEEIVLSLFTGDIDSALTHHAEVCARNQRIAAKRRAPVVTSRDESSPVEPNRTEPNRTELNRTELNRTELKESMADKPPRTRFIPPTLEEVAAYCHERGNKVDPQRFHDYYTANGWTQGKGKPIKDWRAAVRTWEAGRQQERQPVQQQPDLSWRDSHSVTPDDLVEYPEGSGQYCPRWEVPRD